MPQGEPFVGILDAGPEEPKSKALRYGISGVALVLLLSGAMWYFLRYTSEKHTVEHFMDAVIAGDMQKACEIWHTHPGFSCQDFVSFWGPNGYYSPIKSFRLESAEVPPKGGSGVVITVEISAYAPFPKPEETVKFAQNREVQIWVERSDQSLSFPPP
ncbi:MAG: hypothetical protein LAO08_19770 [Acidobacteriia bacterium]|nr:hypothetical protein [Terriglobia bacterium]